MRGSSNSVIAVALEADEVVVVRLAVGELVAGEAVAELALVGDAALGEELHRPVHRRVADLADRRAHLRRAALRW